MIHVICGANENVADSCGPEYSSIDWPRSHLKFHYSHFNFLASSAGSVPTLFFAECVNYDEESDRNRETFCCPVVVPTTNAGACVGISANHLCYSMILWCLSRVLYVSSTDVPIFRFLSTLWWKVVQFVIV